MNEEVIVITREQMTDHQKRMLKVSKEKGITMLEAEQNFQRAHKEYKEALEAMGRETE